MKDCLKTVFFLLKKTVINISTELKKTIMQNCFFNKKDSFFGRGEGGVSGLIVFFNPTKYFFAWRMFIYFLYPLPLFFREFRI